MRIPTAGSCTVLLATLIQGQTLRAAKSCENLSSLTLPNTTITLAQLVPAGKFTEPPRGTTAERKFENLPAFCRVAVTLKPSSDSNIKIEVWAPAAGWNGKFEGVACCGGPGRVNYDAMAAALSHGYATASTLQGGLSALVPGHPELVDGAYRAIHEMTLQAKAIAHAYYDRGPRFSYLTGCSEGGRQGLMEAQRFPADYNAVIVGAPTNFFTHVKVAQLWNAAVTLRNPASGISEQQYQLINQAALAACDAQDGVSDGLISDPLRCNFDPQTLLCQGAASETCLTAAQVEAVKQIYSGSKNPRTGREISPPLMRGSEEAWPALTSFPFNAANAFFKSVFADPNWNWRTFDFDADVAKTDAKLASLFNAVDPNLKTFKRHGGKIIMWHGWNDPSVSPLNSVNYYSSVSRLFGPQQTDDFFRLFMVPGMDHCGGGPGPNDFDALPALEHWVEQGQAPGNIIASHSTNDVVDRTRPLCPYPQVAQYRGTGSTDDAKNFACKVN